MWQSRRADNLTIDSLINRLRAVSRLSLTVLMIASASHGQQPKELHLSKIEVVGLQRLKPKEVITASGLEIGQVVDNSVIDAAAQKLVDSGLFKKLGYHVHSTGDQVVVTFQVEEAIKALPVSFDNFVWFNEGEIFTAIRRDVPYFVGTVPENGDTASKVAASLQRLLNERKIPGQVEFAPYADEASGKQEILFRVKGAKVPVCSISFPGAAAISEADLARTAQPLIKTDYSRKDLSQFGPYTLFPLYRRIGHLAVKFEEPTVKLDENAPEPCANGAEVTIPVDEGSAYSWDKAEWTGNQVLPAAELTTALGMKSGEIADGLKIDKGVQAVHKAYARKGYLAANVKQAFTFDDATQRVTDQFTVNEGPQFHMGNLVVNGLSDDDSRRLKERWRLAAGAVFDQDYLDNFMKTDVKDFLNQSAVLSGLPLKIGVELKPDMHKQTADVIITFK
jgi:outer membrane protein assembly factor BamA